MNKILICICFALALGVLLFAVLKKDAPIAPLPNRPLPQPQPIQEPPQPEPEPEPEPVWPIWLHEPPLRNVTGLGEVLNDIEGHMPAGHIYKDSDKITWGHETTHGIHSRLRQKYSQSGAFSTSLNGKQYFKSFDRINCFYVLENRAIKLKEPNTTLAEVAKNVPRSLRGNVYNLYLIKQQRYWNNEPLYIFDEWVAYGNGACVKNDLDIKNRVGTVRYALEFNVYAMTLAMTAKTDDPHFKSFLMWNLARTMTLYKINDPTTHQKEYLEKMRWHHDGEELRRYIRGYCGTEWTQKILGF